ncbi:hypothetical protein AB1K70_23900, partial [Bremerella sp. JC770]|uniref:hypothetical protein n=1 Tax=Bremerella sp. JC770 TaxID=3232137 RepID=UPI0034579D78
NLFELTLEEVFSCALISFVDRQFSTDYENSLALLDCARSRICITSRKIVSETNYFVVLILKRRNNNASSSQSLVRGLTHF